MTLDKKMCSCSQKLPWESFQGHTVVDHNVCQTLQPDFYFGFGSRDSKIGSADSSIGRYTGDVSTDHSDHLRLRDRTTVGRDSSGLEYIGESSVMCSVKYQSTRKGTRILPGTAKFKKSSSPR